MPTKWLGGFASGTVGGIRTRRYHGLLVAAATPPTNRFMLLNALEASVQTSHGVVDLSSHRYDGQIVHPDGYKTITSFTTDLWPTWRFALPDGSEIEQQIVMRHGAPTVGLSWKLLTPGRGPMTLRVRPLMCGRDFHALHHENPRFNFQPLRNGESLQWQPDD